MGEEAPEGGTSGRDVSPPVGMASNPAPEGVGAARTYAALDLGTNNCRLLIARPTRSSFRVVDAFSRIVRLGEGLAANGRIGEPAVERALGALAVCRDRLEARQVTRMRLIATEACRAAENGAEFLQRVEQHTGLQLEIVDRETEARLAASGCAPLVDSQTDGVVLFDIGGGSTEIVWLARRSTRRGPAMAEVRAWVSLPVGVVTLAERHGGHHVTRAMFEDMVREVSALYGAFDARPELRRRADRLHMLGTSGTVTTIAGVHLNLPRYDRRQVDGLWMTAAEVTGIIEGMLDMPLESRETHPCIGPDRADLVLAGCAILQAIRADFPAMPMRIADRGLREGMLVNLMRADGAWSRRRGKK